MRQALGDCEKLPDDWLTTATMRNVGKCWVRHLVRGRMIRRLGGGMRKYKRVLRGRGIMRELKRVDRNTKEINERQRRRWQRLKQKVHELYDKLDIKDGKKEPFVW